MENISRRNALLGAAGAGLLSVFATATPAAAVSTERTTIVYAPHQDDETLRLTGYLRRIKEIRPNENFILVAVTDGGASAARSKTNLTVGQFMAVRRAEQAAAWSYLTDNGRIIRLGLPDGGVRPQKAAVTAIASQLQAEFPNSEHYCACRLDDTHDDHRAVAEAVRDSGARVVRYSRPTTATGGSMYVPSPGYIWGAERARLAFQEIGWLSVRSSFDQLKARNYASYISQS